MKSGNRNRTSVSNRKKPAHEYINDMKCRKNAGWGISDTDTDTLSGNNTQRWEN